MLHLHCEQDTRVLVPASDPMKSLCLLVVKCTLSLSSWICFGGRSLVVPVESVHAAHLELRHLCYAAAGHEGQALVHLNEGGVVGNVSDGNLSS